MKSTDGAARDGDEAKRKNLSGKDRPGAVNEVRERGHEDLWANQKDARCKRKNGPCLDEGAQVVARCKQEPNGQGGSSKAVNDDGQGEGAAAQRKYVGPGRRIRHPLPCDNCEKNKRHAHDRGFQDAAGPDETKIQTKQDGDRNSHRQCERGPRRGLESVHYDETDDGEKDRHDREHRQLRDEAAAFAYLFARHLAERFPIPTNRAEQNDEILHTTRECRTGDQPERTRQVAELRGERGADERAGARDGGEMVAEEHPLVGGHEVATVVVPFAGRSSRVIERENLCGNKGGIEAKRDEIAADRGDDKPDSVQRFAAMQCDGAECARAQNDDANPDCNVEGSLHFAGPAGMLDLMNWARSDLSLASEGAWTYIMWPAS